MSFLYNTFVGELIHILGQHYYNLFLNIRFMEKINFLLLAAIGWLCCMSVSAHDFVVDGIYYNITSSADKTVEVTYKGDTFFESYEYSDAVSIPELVTYSGSIYSVVSIGKFAFGHCSGLTSVEIPNSVTNIGDGAFFNCDGLTSVLIGNSVTRIGQEAFYYCSGLTSIVIPNSVTNIEKSAFSGCSGLTSVVLSNSVPSIGDMVFSGCSGLTSVEIPNSVTRIGQEAFYGCSGLTSMEIPNSVTGIGAYAFRGCSGLTSIVIPNCVTNIEQSAFSGCSGLTSVVIPNSVTSIGSYAFQGCSGLTSVEIGDSVTSIGNWTFDGCSGLTSVEIPNSVTSIGMFAFRGCNNLKSITSLNPTPPTTSSSTFSNYDATLYVPSGAKAAYSEAEYWKKFANIEELAPSIYELTDGEEYNEAFDKTVNTLVYTRTLPNLHWNALYIPFKLPYDVIAEHYDVAYINDVNGYDTDNNGMIDDLAMEIVKIKGGTLKANYPYLIKAKTEADKEMSITLENAVLYAAAENSVDCSSVCQNYIVTGTYIGKTAEDLAGKLVISDSGIWEPLAAGSDLSPFRLYLSIENRDNSPIEVESSAMSRMRIVLDYTPGDVDGDGRFSVVDISGIVGFVLGVDNPNLDARSADVNEDGRYSVVDVSTVVQYVLNGNASQRSVHRARTMVQASEEACSIYAESFSMNPGEEKEIFVNLNNPSVEVTSLQFDLYLPEGISIVSTAEDNELLPEIYTGTRSSRTHMVESHFQSDGAVRCVVYSGMNASLKGNDGDVVSIKLKASDDLAAGNYQLRLSNQEVVLTEDVSTSMHPSETSCNVAVSEVTGINRIPHVESSSVIYDLQGRPAKANQRGIYIVNGKLVIK